MTSFMNKALFTCLSLLTLATIGCSRHNTHFEKSIQVSGNNMRVKVNSIINGRQVHDYDKTFDIAGMTQAQKDSIVVHITDSLSLQDKSGK